MEQQIFLLENRVKALESLEEAIISAQEVLESGAILAFQDPGRQRTVTGDLAGALKEARDEMAEVKQKLQQIQES
jgi:hypothetical protein